MTGRRTVYEIYWEILVYCRTPRSFTSIVNRCDLNAKTGQEYIAFLSGKGYLSGITEEGKTKYRATPAAQEYVTLFSSLYRSLFDDSPGFRL